MYLDSSGPPILYLSWSFQKAWNDTWFLIRMDKLALFRTSRTKRGAKERRRTMTTITTTEREAIHVVSIHVVGHPAKWNRTFVIIRTRVFLCLVVSLSLVFFFSLSYCVCLLVCVFLLVSSISLFPCISNWLSLSLSSTVVNISSWSEIRSFRSLVL